MASRSQKTELKTYSRTRAAASSRCINDLLFNEKAFKSLSISTQSAEQEDNAGTSGGERDVIPQKAAVSKKKVPTGPTQTDDKKKAPSKKRKPSATTRKPSARKQTDNRKTRGKQKEDTTASRFEADTMFGDVDSDSRRLVVSGQKMSSGKHVKSQARKGGGAPEKSSSNKRESLTGKQIGVTDKVNTWLAGLPSPGERAQDHDADGWPTISEDDHDADGWPTISEDDHDGIPDIETMRREPSPEGHDSGGLLGDKYDTLPEIETMRLSTSGHEHLQQLFPDEYFRNLHKIVSNSVKRPGKNKPSLKTKGVLREKVTANNRNYMVDLMDSCEDDLVSSSQSAESGILYYDSSEDRKAVGQTDEEFVSTEQTTTGTTATYPGTGTSAAHTGTGTSAAYTGTGTTTPCTRSGQTTEYTGTGTTTPCTRTGTIGQTTGNSYTGPATCYTGTPSTQSGTECPATCYTRTGTAEQPCATDEITPFSATGLSKHFGSTDTAGGTSSGRIYGTSITATGRRTGTSENWGTTGRRTGTSENWGATGTETNSVDDSDRRGNRRSKRSFCPVPLKRLKCMNSSTTNRGVPIGLVDFPLEFSPIAKLPVDNQSDKTPFRPTEQKIPRSPCKSVGGQKRKKGELQPKNSTRLFTTGCPGELQPKNSTRLFTTGCPEISDAMPHMSAIRPDETLSKSVKVKGLKSCETGRVSRMCKDAVFSAEEDGILELQARHIDGRCIKTSTPNKNKDKRIKLQIEDISPVVMESDGDSSHLPLQHYSSREVNSEEIIHHSYSYLGDKQEQEPYCHVESETIAAKPNTRQCGPLLGPNTRQCGPLLGSQATVSVPISNGQNSNKMNQLLNSNKMNQLLKDYTSLCQSQTGRNRVVKGQYKHSDNRVVKGQYKHSDNRVVKGQYKHSDNMAKDAEDEDDDVEGKGIDNEGDDIEDNAVDIDDRYECIEVNTTDDEDISATVDDKNKGIESDENKKDKVIDNQSNFVDNAKVAGDALEAMSPNESRTAVKSKKHMCSSVKRSMSVSTGKSFTPNMGSLFYLASNKHLTSTQSHHTVSKVSDVNSMDPAQISKLYQSFNWSSRRHGGETLQLARVRKMTRLHGRAQVPVCALMNEPFTCPRREVWVLRWEDKTSPDRTKIPEDDIGKRSVYASRHTGHP